MIICMETFEIVFTTIYNDYVLNEWLANREGYELIYMDFVYQRRDENVSCNLINTLQIF